MSPVPDNDRTSDDHRIENEHPDFVINTSSSDSDGVDTVINYGADIYGYTALPQDPDSGTLFNTQLQDDDESSDDERGDVDLVLDAVLTQQVDRSDLVNCASGRIDSTEDILPCDSMWNTPGLETTIPMDGENMDKIIKAMAGFQIPAVNQPVWATAIVEETWKERLLSQIHQSQDIQPACFWQEHRNAELCDTDTLQKHDSESTELSSDNVELNSDNNT